MTQAAPPPLPDAPGAPGRGTDPAALDRLWRILRICLDVLMAGLWLFVVVRADGPVVWAWAGVFAVVYAAGRFRADEYGPGLPTWPWLAAVSLAFGGLAWATPDAAFLVFPLFFVVMHVATGWAAVALVVALTAGTMLGMAHHGVMGVGAVIGPVLGASVAIVVGVGFRLLLHEALQRERAITELVAARADVADMSRRAGELDERARLAADIHDTVAQGLSSIHLLLHSVERSLADDGGAATDAGSSATDAGGGAPDGTSGAGAAGKPRPDHRAFESVRMARRVAADNLAETRRIIAALQPAPLAGADLPVALARVCAATPVTADGATPDFTVDGDPRPLPVDLDAALLRAAQASVGNVAKHAAATRCTVTLTYQPDAVILDVVDDGSGFDPDAAVPESAVGISGVRRRMAAFGGTVAIESAPGTGCGVSVHVPLPEAADPAAPTAPADDTAPTSPTDTTAATDPEELP